MLQLQQGEVTPNGQKASNAYYNGSFISIINQVSKAFKTARHNLVLHLPKVISGTRELLP